MYNAPILTLPALTNNGKSIFVKRKFYSFLLAVIKKYRRANRYLTLVRRQFQEPRADPSRDQRASPQVGGIWDPIMFQ